MQPPDKKYKYALLTIEGTEDIVKKELLEAFPDSKIINVHKGELGFESSVEDVDKFRELLSPLRIMDEKGDVKAINKRYWRMKTVPAGLHPSIAYVMCYMAGVKPTDTVLDPFCGAGTIPITAGVYFQAQKIIASDIKDNAIDAAKFNFLASMLPKERYHVFRRAINQLRLGKESIDKVITNLPFGIRAGTHKMNVLTYKNFEKRMEIFIKVGGKLVILTQEKRLIRTCFNNEFWKLIDIVKVNEGGLKPDIFIYEKIKAFSGKMPKFDPIEGQYSKAEEEDPKDVKDVLNKLKELAKENDNLDVNEENDENPN